MRRTSGTICIILGLLLIAAALGLTAYNFKENERAGEASAEVTERLLEIMPETAQIAPDEMFMEFGPEPTEHPEDSHIGTVSTEMAVEAMGTVQIEDYRYIGILEIPALKMTLPVMELWDYNRLMIAPCRYTGNVYSNDMVICAHNFERHFYPLFDAEPGMDVYFSTMDGTVFHYKVSYLEELQPDQVEQMTNPGGTHDWDLTLFTCYLGGRSRCTVRCVRV